MSEQKILAAISGVAFVVGMLIFGGFYYSAQSVNTKDNFAVTGSAKTRVTADQGKLIINLSRIAPAANLSTGYSQVAHDLSLTRELLKKAGIADENIAESPVSMNQVYDQNTFSDLRYQLSQTVTVQSGDVNKITDISKQVPSLAAQGAIISVQSLEYYYSKLPDLRVSLLTEAVKDAKARAEKIAAGTGRQVGSVQAASSGVVQVLPPDSVDVSDYGSYDTSSIEKDVMVTVKASFRLK
ncbi:MAG: SIMPL domain-containing protein [Methanothrix sp.]|nr:SIMPL domain-containing protein [Methanothrix sp.]